MAFLTHSIRIMKNWKVSWENVVIMATVFSNCMDIYSRFSLACFWFLFGQTVVLTNQKRLYILASQRDLKQDIVH